MDIYNLNVIFSGILISIINYLPKLIVGIIVFLVGRIIANSIAEGIKRITSLLQIKKFIDSFQLGIQVSDEFETSFSHLLSLVARYAILYITLIFTLQIIGLSGIATFLAGIVTFLPRILSAVIIILIGLILAGLAETLVKKAITGFDPSTARLVGKITSYTVLVFFILMSLAELGLATLFINTLFIGFVAGVSLAFGLAVGLGSKDVVGEILKNWYTRRRSGRQSPVAKQLKTR